MKKVLTFVTVTAIISSLLKTVCNFTVGVDDAEGTPVPIPNTEVKLSGVEDT